VNLFIVRESRREEQQFEIRAVAIRVSMRNVHDFLYLDRVRVTTGRRSRDMTQENGLNEAKLGIMGV
jgi:hypothetical protein